jgi:radical SAM-linked protein
VTADISNKVQRIRVRFARDAEASDIGAVDLNRAWEGALRAGGVPVSYSSGRNRHARITTTSAGLAHGTTSDWELMDVFLCKRIPAAEVLGRVRDHLPAGLRALDAREIGVGLPSLPSSTRWADYDVALSAGQDQSVVVAAVEQLLSASVLPWEDTRGEKVRQYDLRALVDDLRATSCGDSVHISMRLRCDASGVGRPEQVVKALGLPEPVRIHRVRVVVDEPSPAREAWRRRGRFLT